MQAIDARLWNGVDEVDEVVVHPHGSHSLVWAHLILSSHLPRASSCNPLLGRRSFFPFTIALFPRPILLSQLPVYFLF